MKTHAILLNKSELNLSSFKKVNIKDIYEYINYKLSPFQSLGVFKFNNFSNVESPIYGEINPNMLISNTINWISIRNKIIKNFFNKNSIDTTHTIDTMILSLEEIYIFNILSGTYNYDTQFFYAKREKSILLKEDIHELHEKPENFLLAFTNIYQ